MAVKHRNTHLCELVIRDESGKLSLINIFDNIQIEQFPGGLARMYLVVVLDADPGETVEVSVEGPRKNSVVAQMECPVEGDPRPRKEFQQRLFQLVAEVRGAIFHTPGVYQVVVRSGGRVLDRHPFGVVQATRPEESVDGGT